MKAPNAYKRASKQTNESIKTARSISPQQRERVSKGLRKAKRAIQTVRQRISQGFLRFTYTDEWIAEAF